MSNAEEKLKKKLTEREENNLLRSLVLPNKKLVDFASNDYLGFSKLKVDINHDKLYGKESINSSTGSRLLTGNHPLIEEIEELIAKHHQAESALIFNSGYDANLGLFSCVPQKGDTVLFDELIHASIRDGIRLSHANAYKFKHNNTEHLKSLLKKTKGQVYIAVESVYSMDGDFAPLQEITKIASEHKAEVIVDEAHATGIFGEKGTGKVVEQNLEEQIFARVHTFGKALGCHGAAVDGSKILTEYLINFSRPFIYTTALPPHSILAIKNAYKLLNEENFNNLIISDKIYLFKLLVKDLKFSIIPSESPIQCIVIPGNEKAKKAASYLAEKGYDVRPVLSPTVKTGKERLRICLHTYNSNEEIKGLAKALSEL